MLYLNNLGDYINGLEECISVSAKIDTDTCTVLTTTEVYKYEFEGAIVEKLDQVKDNSGFVGCKKKFVPAKEKKGEIVDDEYWLLTITINHAE